MTRCEREHNCPLKKRYYIASGAQANYRTAIITTFWPIISAKIRSLRPRGRQIGGGGHSER